MNQTVLSEKADKTIRLLLVDLYYHQCRACNHIESFNDNLLIYDQPCFNVLIIIIFNIPMKLLKTVITIDHHSTGTFPAIITFLTLKAHKKSNCFFTLTTKQQTIVIN